MQEVTQYLKDVLQNTFQHVPGTMPVWLVVVLGVGIVFIGLICIIILCSLVGAVMQRINRKAPAAPEEIPNRGELIAAVSAAVAEELGEDVRRIRILSIKKV